MISLMSLVVSPISLENNNSKMLFIMETHSAIWMDIIKKLEFKRVIKVVCRRNSFVKIFKFLQQTETDRNENFNEKFTHMGKSHKKYSLKTTWWELVIRNS